MEIQNMRNDKLLNENPLIYIAEGDYIGAEGFQKIYVFSGKVENGVINIINAKLDENIKNKIKEKLLQNDLNPIQRDIVMKRV